MAVVVLVSLLIGVIVTSPRRASSSGQAPTVLPTLEPESVNPFAVVQGLDAIRRQLAAFSDDEFLVVNLLDAPVDVRVTTPEQAEFVAELLGSSGLGQVTLVTGDLGITPPDSIPASMHDLLLPEKTSRRHTLLRIVEYEQGGGTHIRIMPGRGDIRVAFEDDRYYTMALEFFGPDIRLQEWVPSVPGIFFNQPAPFPSPPPGPDTSGVRSWTIAGLAAVGLVVLGLVVTLGWRRRHSPPNPAMASLFLFVGVSLLLQLALSDAVAQGQPGWKRGVALIVGLAAFTFAMVELSRPELLGRRWTLLIFLTVLVGSLAVVHARWLNERPSYEATLTITIDQSVTALPEPATDVMEELVEREAERIRALAPSIRLTIPDYLRDRPIGTPWPELPGTKLIVVLDVDVRRATYPVELGVRVGGTGTTEVAVGGADLFADYQVSRAPGWLAELRGPMTGSLSEPERVEARLGRLVLGYGLAIGLILLVVPWPWWRDPDEEGELADPVPDKPQLDEAGV